MATQIQLRRGTAATWTSVNPILAQGEIGYELDTHYSKIGDGVLTWNALPYTSASYAANGGGSGMTLFTASLYQITASQAVSASWAPSSGGSGTTLFTSSTYQITASRAISASWAPFTDTGTTLFTGSTYNITSSVSVNSKTASYFESNNPLENPVIIKAQSNQSWMAGVLNYNDDTWNDSIVIGNSNTSSNYVGTVIGIANRVVLGEDTNVLGENNQAGSTDQIFGFANNSNIIPGSGNGRVLIGIQNNASGSTNNTIVGVFNNGYADYAHVFGSTLSNRTASSVEIGVSNDTKATFATYGVLFRVPITASVLQGTSSWATSASWAPGIQGTGTTLFTASTLQVTSSWSSNSTTASYALNGGTGNGTTLTTASLYQITSSRAVTASFASTALTSITSSYTVTASYTNIVVQSSSFASASVSSSWASSSAFAPVVFTDVQIINGKLTIHSPSDGLWYAMTMYSDGSGSIGPQFELVSGTGSIYASGSIYAITQSYIQTSSISASWASSSLTSSYAFSALTASFALNGVVGGSGTTLTTASLYQITTSWAVNTVNGGSGTNIFTASTLQVTSSWATNATTASFALNGGGSGTTLFTASTYQITASRAVNSTSASYSPIEPAASASLTALISTKQGTLVTASTIPLTASWAANTSATTLFTSSLYQITASISANAITSSAVKTTRWNIYEDNSNNLIFKFV